MSYDTIIGYAKDFAALAPLVTAGCAIWALRAWRRQLRKQTDHALAKKILQSAMNIVLPIAEYLQTPKAERIDLKQLVSEVKRKVKIHEMDLLESNAVWDFFLDKYADKISRIVEDLEKTLEDVDAKSSFARVNKVLNKMHSYTTGLEIRLLEKVKI